MPSYLTVKNEKKGINPKLHIDELSTLFSQNINDKAAFIKSLVQNAKTSNALPKPAAIKHEKNESKSVAARNTGNRHMMKQNYIDALKAYNESLCWAPTGSESLGLAYANRSSIYLNCGFYKFCLVNIELALENNYPEKLKPKLMKRKEECLEKMKNDEDSEEKYDYKDYLPKLTYAANPKMPFMIDGLELKKNEKYGRHIVTTRNLKIGDLISMEEPIVKAVSCKKVYSICFYCCKNEFYNLVPCPKSVCVMFCSKKCADSAWESHYKFQCPIIDGVMNAKIYLLLSLHAVLKAFRLFNNPLKLMSLVEYTLKNPLSPFDVDLTQADEVTKFRAMLFLSRAEQMDHATLFEHYKSIAGTFYLLKEFTEFKDVLKTPELEDFFLDLFVRIVFIMKTNSSFVDDKQESLIDSCETTTGLFLAESMYNHSCLPNIYRVPSNGKMYLTVLRPIKAGEQLFETYGPKLGAQSLEERQLTLKTLYHFDCSCKGCHISTIPESPKSKFDISKKILDLMLFINNKQSQYDKGSFDMCIAAKKDIIKLLSKSRANDDISKVHLELSDLLTFCFNIDFIKKPLESILAVKN